jgi:hypothetical protein
MLNLRLRTLSNKDDTELATAKYSGIKEGHCVRIIREVDAIEENILLYL